jgi:hypothetical protein
MAEPYPWWLTSALRLEEEVETFLESCSPITLVQQRARF